MASCCYYLSLFRFNKLVDGTDKRRVDPSIGFLEVKVENAERSKIDEICVRLACFCKEQRRRAVLPVHIVDKLNPDSWATHTFVNHFFFAGICVTFYLAPIEVLVLDAICIFLFCINFWAPRIWGSLMYIFVSTF